MAPSVILVLGKFRQEDHEFWASLGYTAGKKEKEEESNEKKEEGRKWSVDETSFLLSWSFGHLGKGLISCKFEVKTGVPKSGTIKKRRPAKENLKRTTSFSVRPGGLSVRGRERNTSPVAT